MVVPAQTGIGEEVLAGRAAGTTFARFEAASIAEAVGEALAGLDALEAKAASLTADGAHTGEGYLTRLRERVA